MGWTREAIHMALWLAQAPVSLPDLFWLVLTSALGLLVAGVGLCVRLMWVVLSLRLEALQKEIDRLKRWQEDREP